MLLLIVKLWLEICLYQVIIEKLTGSNIDDLDKRKFLVPSDLTIGQLVWIIRKRIKVPSEKALHVYVHRTIPSTRSVHSNGNSFLVSSKALGPNLCLENYKLISYPSVICHLLNTTCTAPLVLDPDFHFSNSIPYNAAAS